MDLRTEAEPHRPVARTRPRDRKAQILRTAADLFVARGFHEVTMSDIAAKQGITAGALYRHFAGKTQILKTIIQGTVDRAREAGTGQPTLEAALSARMAVIMESPHVGVLWSRELRHLDPDDRARMVSQLRDDSASYVRHIVARRPRIAKDDAIVLARAIQSILASASSRLRGLGKDEYARVLEGAALAVADVELPRPALLPEPPESPLEPGSRREYLLVVASRLFGTVGYHETSLADIGAAARVTGPSLYWHFESKADILRAVTERAEHALWMDLHSALADTDDPSVALGAVLDSYVRMGQSSPHIIHYLVVDGGPPDSRSRQLEYLAEIEALLRAARPDLDRAVVHALVRAAISTVNDLSRGRQLARRSDFPTVTRAIVDAILASQAVSSRPRRAEAIDSAHAH